MLTGKLLFLKVIEVNNNINLIKGLTKVKTQMQLYV